MAGSSVWGRSRGTSHVSFGFRPEAAFLPPEPCALWSLRDSRLHPGLCLGLGWLPSHGLNRAGPCSLLVQQVLMPRAYGAWRGLCPGGFVRGKVTTGARGGVGKWCVES